MSALGQKQDTCSASIHVRFAPNSDRESGFPQTVMSALPPKADMCAATRDVCFGPKADTGQPPAFSLCSAANCLCSMPNIVDQAPNTTVTRSVVYEIVTMYIPQ